MVLLFIIILVLILVSGGFYTTRPGYAGFGAGAGNILYILAVILGILLVLHLLGLVPIGMIVPMISQAMTP